MEGKIYDLIVIGSGAGLNVASAVTRLDWQVAIIEKGPLGGTCLNRGCIPSKIIIHTADIAELIMRAHEFGIDAKIDAIDFAKITNRASHFVDHDSKAIENGLEHHPKIDLYKGSAEFIDKQTIEVKDKKLTGERILIAAGARPSVPPIAGLDKIDYLTSTEALRLTRQPKSMIIIGGGYIAAELGHFYGALGTKVTIIQRDPLMIPREDPDIAKAFTELFGKKHEVLLEYEVQHVGKLGDQISVAVASKNGHEKSIEAEKILVAIGITPNSDLLKLENAGVKVNDHGYIEVNDKMQTNVEHIYALGDIVGKAPFRHGANYEAKIISANFLGHYKARADYTVMPHAIFSSPQIAGVGLTEAQVIEQKIPYRAHKFSFTRTAMGKALEEKNGFVKWILDENQDKILGCHILGPEASILIHEVVVAMQTAGAKVSAIRDTIHIHPALSEVVRWGI